MSEQSKIHIMVRKLNKYGRDLYYVVNKKELRYNYENDVLDFIDCYDNTSTEDDYYLTPKPFTLEVVEWKN